MKTTVFSPPLGDVVLPIAPDGLDSSALGGDPDFVAAVQAVAGAGQTLISKQDIIAPLPADLVSIVGAVTPSNVALTIAAQPPQARKLQIRIVIGTTTT